MTDDEARDWWHFAALVAWLDLCVVLIGVSHP